MPTIQAVAYANWCSENEASIFGSNMIRVSPGYIDQQIDRLLAQKRRVK